MTRSGKVKKRKIEPDLLYSAPMATRFINKVMRDGKKALAQKIVYSSLEKAAQELKDEPMDILKQAIENVAPHQEVRPRRVGGATYQIPIPVRGERREALAMRWVIDVVKKRKGRSMVLKLSEELMNAYRGTGEAVKKKEAMHKMAEANRAFAHFRW